MIDAPPTLEPPLRVLLVGDHPGDARMVEARLEEGELATDLVRCRDLEEADARLGEREFDVCLLDLSLPDSTGVETVERFRQMADEDLPVVVLTGLAGAEAAVEAIRAGAEEYLVRDEVTGRVLVRTLRYVVERARARRERRQAKERWEKLFERSPVAKVVSDRETGRLLAVNDAFLELAGMEEEEVLDRSVLALGFWDDPERRRQLVGRVREEGSFEGEEATFRDPTGRERHMLVACQHLDEAVDDRLIWTVQDITERVEHERALGERVKEQSCLYDVARLLHADDRPLEVRLEAVVDRLPAGWQYPEITAARIRLEGEAWYTGRWAAVENTLEAPIAVNGEPIGRVQVGYTERRPEAGTGPFLPEEERLLDAIADQIGIAVDRHRTVEQLEAERSRLAEIFEQSPAFAAAGRGPEHVFEMANPAYRDLVGDRELLGRPVREALPELEGTGYFELLDHVFETGETVRREEEVLELEDEEGVRRRYVSFVYQPRREGGEVVGVVAHGVDVTEQVEKRQEAEDREEKLERIVRTSADGILLTDAEGDFTFANPAAEEMLGLEADRITERTYDDPAWEITDPEGEAFPEEELPVARVLRSGEPVQGIEFAVRRPDGGRLILSANAGPLRGPDGGVQGVVSTIRDVTEERRRREALRKSEARYRTLVETMAEATVIADPEGRITFANAEAEELLGFEASDLVDRTYDDPGWRITSPEGGPLPDEELPFRKVMETGRPVRDVEHGIERPDGERRVLAVNAAPMAAEGEGPTGVVATIRDVTERKQMEEELRDLALHDVLTGLANRALFRDRLEQDLARARRQDEAAGLLILDLDRFKQVNDHLGHTAGDRLLEEVARRLEAEVREEDTVARLGGDEFAVIVPSVDCEPGLRSVVDRLLQALGRPFGLGGEQVEIDVTVGAVLVCDRDVETAVPLDDAGDAVRYADLALYEAKRRAGSSFHLFHPEADRDRAEQLGREQELRRAIRASEFEVHFQPIVRIEDATVWGVEPLARWRHPDRGWVAPAEFIPVAEETGLIHELGELLLREACREVASWPETAAGSLRIHPNLSGRQFEDDGLVETLVGIVEEAGLAPARFGLEVTESAITRATGAVEELRGEGFRIFVDDFGTGYSSFHYLRDLELDGLKIDRSFLQGSGEPKGRGLLETMIAMGRSLEMTVVAEGIETPAQREALQEIGCELGQGFLFARPMPAGEMAEWLGGDPELLEADPGWR